jgi:hypothetical protein
MASELYIEDKLVDLPTDADISIEYAIAKIGEIEKRSGVRSAEFTIPKTAKNKAIFENPDDVNNIGTKPYRRLKARYYSNGIDQQISFATLKESAQGYNVNIYGGNSDFFAALKDGKLTDIDFSAYDYYHTLTNYVATRTDLDIPRSIALNVEQPTAIALGDIRYQPPSVSIEFLLEQMAASQGYTLNNETKLKYGYPNQLMVLPLCKEWLRDFNGDKYNCEFYSDTKVASTPIIDRVKFTDFISGDPKYFTPQALALWDGYICLNDELQITYSLTITVDVSLDFAPLMLPLGIRIRNGTSIVNTLLVPYLSVPAGLNTYTITGTNSVSPQSGYDDSVALYVDIFPTNDTINNLPTVTFVEATISITNVNVLEPTKVNGSPSTIFLSRQFCTVNSLIPDTKQSELIATYLKLTCSLIQVDEVNKVVNIVPFEKLNDNIANSLDWSNKLDLTDTPQITFAVDGYAQRNLCRWQYDERIDPNQNATFANGVITLDDQNLDDEQDLIEIDFSASTQALTGGLVIADLQIFNDDGTFKDEIDQRILFAKFNDVAFTYTDGTTNSAQTTDILLTHFQKSGEINLGFDDNLIPTFYQAFIDVLDKAKIVTCLLRLNASDINQLDLTIPVYIEYFNSYFYVSKISGYNPNRNVSTLVELVKLY